MAFRNSSGKDPIRILHIVGGMGRGGVETWLMHVLRHIDRDRFCMNFLVHTTRPCAYDEEIRSLGSKIIPCLHPSRPLQYAMNFKQILGNQGPYDVVHSHVHHFSGFVTYLARRVRVPIRASHSHNDTTLYDERAGMLRKGYLQLMEHLIRRDATMGLACSRKAAAALYGAKWERDDRWRVLHYGIDLEPFKQPINNAEVRRELGIPKDSFVIGHVGRFHEQKNHSFLIDIFSELSKLKANAILLLVGDGTLRSVVEQKVISLGLSKRVVFAGLRSDIPRIMRGAMDTFLFPSLFEGLPVALLEAQAAGLPCVISNAISEEADIIEPLFIRISLSSTVSEWASAVISSRYQKMDCVQALVFLNDSSINILRGMKELEHAYGA